jgi:uncharacterized protein (DUF2147 family)
MKPGLALQHLFASLLAASTPGERGPKEAQAPPAVALATGATAAATAAPAFEKLLGKRQRPDGGYVIEIRSVKPGGKLEAGYFNPQPINVAKAEASQDAGIVTVLIELRDVNYPGSTYKQTYDPVDDRLKGKHYQTVVRKIYSVFFERRKP